MFKTIPIIVMAVLCLNFSGKAQSQNNNIKPLKIGDTIPKELWNFPLQVVNHPEGKDTITLNDYKGKLIILDFWATWCTSCIASFPKIEALGKEFSDKVHVIAVTYEDKKIIADFFASKVGSKFSITSIVNDTFLSTLFYHQLIPHYVWIGTDGLVKAITSSNQLDPENVRSAVLNNTLAVPTKYDIDAKRPLFTSDQITLNDLQLYTLLSKGSYSGLPTGSRIRKNNDTVVGRAFTNASLLTIFKSVAMPMFTNLGDVFSLKRLKINLEDKIQFDEIYNIDVIVPIKFTAQLYQIMLNVLNQYSGCTGTIVKQKEKCLVLVYTGSNTKNVATKGGTMENSLFYKSPGILINQPVSALIMMLNHVSWIPLPVVDETQYKGNIDLILRNSEDLNELKVQLKAYGFELIETERMLNMFVLNADQREATLSN